MAGPVDELAERECREFGWHVQWEATAGQLVAVRPDVPGSGPDWARLYEQARWDAAQGRWVVRQAD